MYKLFFIFLSIILFNNDRASYVEGKGFSGYIFNKKHSVFMTIENQKERFTPTKNEIEIIEVILKSKLKCKNENKENQIENCPIIHKKLTRYVRQYVGFINDKGEKIIWINFLWKKNINKELLEKDIVIVADGCSYYWNVKINFENKELYDLEVNGKS